MNNSNYQFPPEIKHEFVKFYFEQKDLYPSKTAAIKSLSLKFGCSITTLQRWIKDFNKGKTHCINMENYELKRINKILLKNIFTT